MFVTADTFTRKSSLHMTKALLTMFLFEKKYVVRNFVFALIFLHGEGERAFCAGGDQKIRGDGGYVDDKGVPRLNILDVHKQIRSLPKPVIASVAGFAVGGGHVLHIVCDLTIAADNARFGQTGPKVGSFDGGLGSGYL